MNKSRYDKYARYKNSKEYGFTLLPNIDVNNTEFIKITFNQGDRLDLLAKKYFKDSTFWWVIAIVNNLTGDSLVLEPGTELYIPRSHLKYVY
jgi:hypothetical protein